MKTFQVLKRRGLCTGSVCSIYRKTPEKSISPSAVKKAERVVGYSTSFLSLRWILNDEIANVATHVRKLIETNHPLMKTAKNLLFCNDQQPTWGLVVLLVSKTAGLNSVFPELECDKTADILHSQRIVAEVTEMIKTSHLIHKGILTVDPSDKDFSDLNFGNKIALLCGDYLLSRSFHEVALLKNFLVQELISSTLRDLAEGQFLGQIPTKPSATQKSIPIPIQLDVKPFRINQILGHMKSEWILRNILSGGSLLGRCCQCSLILANHGLAVQKLGYSIGRNVALAWQASLEKNLSNDFSLVSAPVMFHLEYAPGFYDEIARENVDLNYVKKVVKMGPGLEKTNDMQNEFAQLALRDLDQLEKSESKVALVNIIKSM